MIPIQWTSPPARATRVDLLAAGGFAVWIAAWVWPWLPVRMPRCHFLAFTGYPCGTCGFTRAFVRAARFELAGAFSVSPLGTGLFLAWLVASVWIGLRWLGMALPLPRIDDGTRAGRWTIRWGFLLLFLLNWGYLLLFRWVKGTPPA